MNEVRDIFRTARSAKRDCVKKPQTLGIELLSEEVLRHGRPDEARDDAVRAYSPRAGLDRDGLGDALQCTFRTVIAC